MSVMDTPPNDKISGIGADGSTKEAAVWFARLLDPAAPAEDFARFRVWLEADPANAQAYARLERLWAQAAFEPSTVEDRNSRRTFLKTASGVALIAATGGTVLTLAARPDFSTATGEVRTFMLPDGSQMQLSAASSASIDLTPSMRRIILHSGEAYFSVKAEPDRPFSVEAGPIRATALGTEYSVARFSDHVSVSVTQHSVVVEADGQKRRLGEGDAIDWRDHRLGAVLKDEAENRVSWRKKQLVFLARPLDEVIAEINRWRRGRLVIFDRGIAARPITAIIDLGDIDGIDATLEQGLPIKLSDYTPFMTLVSAR